ncbi:MAG: AI-2E family transporter YdiK [Rhodocyclaceae bacterium]|nr:AI-2E family transporter YdiK [Rhodocyclaceae bacterium]
MPAPRHDLTRTLLAVACIAGLVGASFWILKPFLGAAVWAAMLVVATWPLFLALERRLGDRRGPAVAIMALALLLLLVVPLWLAIGTLVDNADRVADWGRTLAERGLPPPPDFVRALPLIGERLAGFWRETAAAGPEGLIGRATPYAANVGAWLAAEAGGVGVMLVQFLLVVALAAVMYGSGEAAAAKLLRFGRRLAGERGENAVVLAAQAIRGVALGVGVTAIVQTLLGGVGLAVAGVPFAGFLSALMLMLCIAQIGPMLVLLPAAGWLFWSGDTGWAIALFVWSLIVGTLDNFLRPVLIKRGADLPLLLIFAGVIGGMLGFGLIGLFIGPVVLAVTWTLLEAWVADALGPADDSDAA